MVNTLFFGVINGSTEKVLQTSLPFSLQPFHKDEGNNIQWEKLSTTTFEIQTYREPSQ
jgi:hypothetical protein